VPKRRKRIIDNEEKKVGKKQIKEDKETRPLHALGKDGRSSQGIERRGRKKRTRRTSGGGGGTKVRKRRLGGS